MKGKDTFTLSNINQLKELINIRNKTQSSGQKAIRQKMRNIGFYGKDDWGIIDLQLSDLDYLINSGKIKIIDDKLKSFFTPSIVSSEVRIKSTETNFEINNSTDLFSILEIFKGNQFDPQIHTDMKVSNMSGNYIVCLRKNSKLPNTSYIPIYTKFEGLDVIYTGIASISLRTRDYRQHFKGNNAGRSTLRKSLGVLFGYKQIPRDQGQNNGKTKFNEQDEYKLSDWMHSNLVMFTLPTMDYNNIEIRLIKYFNPPLNLKANKNNSNLDFRQLLSKLRAFE